MAALIPRREITRLLASLIKHNGVFDTWWVDAVDLEAGTITCRYYEDDDEGGEASFTLRVDMPANGEPAPQP
jgi:hypothetical protein